VTTTTSTTTTAAPVVSSTTTTLAALGPGGPGDDSFLGNNWWWLTIIGLTLIALIATIAILQPQRQIGAARVAGVPMGRHVRRRTYGPRETRVASPTVAQRVKRTRVAQSVVSRTTQTKPPKPSLFRRMANWFRDTEIADSMRARSDARRVQHRTSRSKPPKIKRRRT
jgi:hypothetical protein